MREMYDFFGTCEPTCESAWPLTQVLVLQTCGALHGRLSPFGQGFTDQSNDRSGKNILQ